MAFVAGDKVCDPFRSAALVVLVHRQLLVAGCIAHVRVERPQGDVQRPCVERSELLARHLGQAWHWCQLLPRRSREIIPNLPSSAALVAA